jgi:DNA-binding transcriptional ArsR family regulator
MCDLLSLLGERPCAVKHLVSATGERQAKISQHLTVMQKLGIVRTQRAGTEAIYSLADPRILEACRITRDVLLQQLTQQASLAAPLVHASILLFLWLICKEGRQVKISEKVHFGERMTRVASIGGLTSDQAHGWGNFHKK